MTRADQGLREFSLTDVISKQTLHGAFFSFFLDSQSRISVVRLFLLGMFGVSLVSIASLVDGVFGLGTVTSVLADGQVYLGMSFLGDTMVWPFCFLVPTALAVMLRTVKQLVDFLNEWSSATIFEDVDPSEKTKIFQRTRELAQGRIYPRVSIFWLCWALSVGIIAYNATVCGFAEMRPNSDYPYRTMTPILESGAMLTNVLSESAIVPKWDCSFSSPPTAPIANISSRVWTIVFYGIPPIILGLLVSQIFAICYFLSRSLSLARKRNVETLSDLPISPFGSDPHGGLGKAADVGMGFFYTSNVFLFLVFMSLFKEATPPSSHNVLLIAAIIPLTMCTVVIPADYVRRFISETKNKALDIIGFEMSREIKKLASDNPHENNFPRIEALNLLHERTKNIPEWPFESSVLIKGVLTLAIPMSGIAYDLVMRLVENG